MTATNIDIEEFINVLTEIYASGVKLMNLDMLPDENHPSMNKLIIHPVKVTNGTDDYPQNTKRLIVKNPNISTDNDDIFNSFKGLL
jgi:hypothetical protein